jgi:protein gp37
MGESTGIQWCDHTFNPWLGCAKVSAECDHCYAERGSARIGAQHGLKLWQGDRYHTSQSYWDQPRRWNRAAKAAGVRRRVFCASYADVFEAREDLVMPRDRLIRLIEDTPALDWLLLTKRPENMTKLGWGEEWPDNVWAGTTVGVRDSLPRLMLLADVPVATRFVSFEPLLEDVGRVQALARLLHTFAWTIIGGESGALARPMDLTWVTSLMDAADNAAKIPVFVKQLGSVWARSVGAKDRHGGDPSEWPKHLRVRQFPKEGIL